MGLKFVGVTSDGASANRSMYRMHLNMTRVEDINDVDVVYHTRNVMAEEERYIYFFSDPPHLLKNARNCLLNSLAGSCTRSMWNQGIFYLGITSPNCFMMIWIVGCILFQNSQMTTSI